MEAIVFCGIPGCGKSTFYRERFFRSHVRINLDMLKTRHRERLLLQACLEGGQAFVVDNTNVSREQRAVYIEAAQAAGFRVVCYYFQSRVEDCRLRNSERTAEEQVPEKAILGMSSRLEIPQASEGYDAMWYVRVASETSAEIGVAESADANSKQSMATGINQFLVEAWQDEI